MPPSSCAHWWRESWHQPDRRPRGHRDSATNTGLYQEPTLLCRDHGTGAGCGGTSTAWNAALRSPALPDDQVRERNANALSREVTSYCGNNIQGSVAPI